ncbi:MAG: C-GCAxxG-C-C family protein [Peptoniphilus sp.]|nr:C-GCAxxG-C-C family protein [Peptoniphilus sp.]MDD7363650.1 C-GCAxxG-C-C family protein [Bacillota bacterium]MDY6044704.1 C-GCAxxG-C-C family protein [Peptoniphilus sp.]
MNRVETAGKLHGRGYNCAQAVACAFVDALDIDEETLFKMNEGFGGGMGCTEGVCGALSAAVMVAGMKNSDGNLENPGSKGATSKLSREMVGRFKEKTGAIICRELKGIDTGSVLSSCDECIQAGVETVQEVLTID